MADEVRPKTIIRIPKRKRFLISNVELHQDARLSWKARGILGYILTLPDDWAIYLEELSRHAPDGLHSTRTGLLELRRFGYVQKVILRRPNGTIAGCEWHVDESGKFTSPERKVALEEGREPDAPAPSKAPDVPPTNPDGWLALLRESNNKPATVRWMIETLYPDREPPDYGYIGEIGKRMKDAGVLARLIWEFSDPKKRPTGDLLAFLWKTHCGRKRRWKGNGSDRTPETDKMTPEEEAKRTAMLEAHFGVSE